VLPANLQGKWGPEVGNPWSGDYRKVLIHIHSFADDPSELDSNINIQMNHWSALTTFPSSPVVQLSLFEYILKNWVPRGAETASLVYGIERGWVAHDEMNVSSQRPMRGSLF
jgi:alpha-L-fucosidase 2